MKITIEAEALDSLQKMVDRLQEERDMLLITVEYAVDNSEFDGRVFDSMARAVIAKCTATPKVME